MGSWKVIPSSTYRGVCYQKGLSLKKEMLVLQQLVKKYCLSVLYIVYCQSILVQISLTLGALPLYGFRQVPCALEPLIYKTWTGFMLRAWHMIVCVSV